MFETYWRGKSQYSYADKMSNVIGKEEVFLSNLWLNKGFIHCHDFILLLLWSTLKGGCQEKSTVTNKPLAHCSTHIHAHTHTGQIFDLWDSWNTHWHRTCLSAFNDFCLKMPKASAKHNFFCHVVLVPVSRSLTVVLLIIFIYLFWLLRFYILLLWLTMKVHHCKENYVKRTVYPQSGPKSLVGPTAGIPFSKSVCVAFRMKCDLNNGIAFLL